MVDHPACRECFRELASKPDLLFVFRCYLAANHFEDLLSFCEETTSIEKNPQTPVSKLSEIYGRFLQGKYILPIDDKIKQDITFDLQENPTSKLFQAATERVAVELDLVHFNKFRLTDLYKIFTGDLLPRKGSGLGGIFSKIRGSGSKDSFGKRDENIETSIDPNFSVDWLDQHPHPEEIVSNIRGVTQSADQIECLLNLYQNDIISRTLTWNRISKIRSSLCLVMEMLSQLNRGFLTQHVYMDEYTEGLLGEPFKLLVSACIREIRSTIRSILVVVYEGFGLLVYLHTLLKSILQAVETGSIPLNLPTMPEGQSCSKFPITPYWTPQEPPKGSAAFNFGTLEIRVKKLLKLAFFECQMTLYRHNLLIKSNNEILFDLKLKNIVSIQPKENVEDKTFCFMIEYFVTNTKEIVLATSERTYGQAWMLAIHTLEPILTTQTLKQLEDHRVNHQTLSRKLSRVQDYFYYDSLAGALSQEKSRQLLKNFMKKKLCLENFLFLEEVRNYKQLLTTTERVPKATQIYNSFIKNGGGSEINIDQKEKDRLGKEYSKAEPWLFDEAETTIILLIEADIWPKFRADPLYQSLVIAEKLNSGGDSL